MPPGSYESDSYDVGFDRNAFDFGDEVDPGEETGLGGATIGNGDIGDGSLGDGALGA